jgi:hypothetical protein
LFSRLTWTTLEHHRDVCSHSRNGGLVHGHAAGVSDPFRRSRKKRVRKYDLRPVQNAGKLGRGAGFVRRLPSCDRFVVPDRSWWRPPEIVLRTKNRKGIERPPKRVTTCLCCTPLGAYRLCNVPMLGAGTGPAGAAVASPERIAETDSDDEADTAMSASRLRWKRPAERRATLPVCPQPDTRVWSQ